MATRSLPAVASTFEISIIDAGTGRAKLLRQQDAAMGEVIENMRLTKEGIPEKRHIGEETCYQSYGCKTEWTTDIKLPDDMTYRAGDYLAMYVRIPTLSG